LTHLLPRALQAAAERQDDKRKGQKNLFDTGAPDSNGTVNGAPVDDLPGVAPWSETEKLKYEKEVLDFYFSSHPLAQREKDVARYASHSIAALKGVPAETEVTLGGMLTQVRLMTYKKPQRNGNTRYGRCKVEDMTGIIESVMWGDEFIRYKDNFVEDQVLLVRGNLERKTDEPMLQITRILTLEQAQRELARELHLLAKVGQHSAVDMDVLGGILRKTPGTCPVILTVKDPAGRRCVLKLGRDFQINPATYLKDELEGLLGGGCVQLC
jgi:DNA polymerase-3 subunit alpha